MLLGALHLGNVIFDDNADEVANVSAACEGDLGHAERVLGVGGLRVNLIEKEILAGGDRMTLQLKPVQAMHSRDALVKQLYVRVFDHLVHCINDSLQTNDTRTAPATVGLLDVFGFESFTRNSFEQLCINLSLIHI